MRQTFPSAKQSVRGVFCSIACHVGNRCLLRLYLENETHTRCPAIPAVAERVGPELVVPEEERKAYLRDFDASEFHAPRRLHFSAARPAVACVRRAGTGTRLEEVPDESATGAWVHTLHRNAEATSPSRKSALRTRARKRLDDHFRDILSDMARAYCRGCRRA